MKILEKEKEWALLSIRLTSLLETVPTSCSKCQAKGSLQPMSKVNLIPLSDVKETLRHNHAQKPAKKKNIWEHDTVIYTVTVNKSIDIERYSGNMLLLRLLHCTRQCRTWLIHTFQQGIHNYIKWKNHHKLELYQYATLEGPCTKF